MEGREQFLSGLTLRPSLAHTGAIFIDVAGTPPPAAAAVARDWIALLDDLENRLGDDRIAEIEVWDWLSYSDGVSVEHVRGQRRSLLEGIAAARAHYNELAGGNAP